MSKQKPIEKRLDLILRIGHLDLMLYTHYRAIKGLAPSISTRQIAESFMREWDIGEDDWALESAIQTLYRYTDTEYKRTNLKPIL